MTKEPKLAIETDIMMDIKNLIRVIYDKAYEVRRVLGSGFLEKVYRNALYRELTELGLQCYTEYPLTVTYKGAPIGDYFVDILVDGRIIIEIKAVETVHPRHSAQLVNYLTATGIDDGILINFGETYCFRHKTRLYSPSNKPAPRGFS